MELGIEGSPTFLFPYETISLPFPLLCSPPSFFMPSPTFTSDPTSFFFAIRSGSQGPSSETKNSSPWSSFRVVFVPSNNFFVAQPQPYNFLEA